MFRRIVTFAAGTCLTVGALMSATAGLASAATTQARTPVDCQTCDQQNAKGNPNHSGFFFDFVCSPSNNGAYLVTYHNKGTTDEVATVNGETATVPPGGKHTFSVPAHVSGITLITRSAVTAGGKVVIPAHVTEFDCPCTPQETTTTVPATTTTVAIGPPTSIVRPPATTLPPRQLAHQPQTTVPVTTSGTLPATGGDTGTLIDVGLILVMFGGLGVAAVAIDKARKAPIAE